MIYLPPPQADRNGSTSMNKINRKTAIYRGN